MAHRAGGEWLVRIEDLDPPREIPGAADDQLHTLERFGLVPDGTVHGRLPDQLGHRLREIVRCTPRYPILCLLLLFIGRLCTHVLCRCLRPFDAHDGSSPRLLVHEKGLAFWAPMAYGITHRQ